MTKQFTLSLIFANIVLSLLYVDYSYRFWEELNNWYDWNMQITWTPFYVYPHRIPNLPTVTMLVPPMLNLPFINFCIIIITNCVLLATYFLTKVFVIPKVEKRIKKDIIKS